jgi:hypothetical protein
MRKALGWALLLAAPALMAQMRQPDAGAQRAAMKKLEFLVGEWEGEARVMRGPGGPVAVRQSERVQMKLGGLLLLVEGTGRDAQTGEVKFQALATVSYDDVAGQYRFRSHSEGRYLDTEMKVEERGFAWGFEAGPARVTYRMKLDEKGEWVEQGEMALGAGAPRPMLEMRVKRVK